MNAIRLAVLAAILLSLAACATVGGGLFGGQPGAPPLDLGYPDDPNAGQNG